MKSGQVRFLMTILTISLALVGLIISFIVVGYGSGILENSANCTNVSGTRQTYPDNEVTIKQNLYSDSWTSKPTYTISGNDMTEHQTHTNSWNFNSTDDIQQIGPGRSVVFLNREDGSVRFNRSWAEYKTGFGNPQGEFWLGLDSLNQLTSRRQYALLVFHGDFKGNGYESCYNNFTIGPESNLYQLALSGYDESSSGHDVFKLSHWDNINTMFFSTYDNDNDKSNNPNTNCALHLNGGWWFNRCGMGVVPTKHYYTSSNQKQSTYNGISWYHRYLKYIQLMLISK